MSLNNHQKHNQDDYCSKQSEALIHLLSDSVDENVSCKEKNFVLIKHLEPQPSNLDALRRSDLEIASEFDAPSDDKPIYGRNSDKRNDVSRSICRSTLSKIIDSREGFETKKDQSEIFEAIKHLLIPWIDKVVSEKNCIHKSQDGFGIEVQENNNMDTLLTENLLISNKTIADNMLIPEEKPEIISKGDLDKCFSESQNGLTQSSQNYGNSHGKEKDIPEADSFNNELCINATNQEKDQLIEDNRLTTNKETPTCDQKQTDKESSEPQERKEGSYNQTNFMNMNNSKDFSKSQNLLNPKQELEDRFEKESDMSITQEKSFVEIFELEIKEYFNNKNRILSKLNEDMLYDQKRRKNSYKVDMRSQGLINIGNSCYMNAVLQALRNIPYFTYYFLSEFYKEDLKRNKKSTCLPLVFADLIKKMRDGHKSNLREVLRKIKELTWQERSNQVSYQQHDAIEFMKMFLSVTNDDLNRINVKPQYKQLSTLSGNENIEKKSNEWFNSILQRDNSIVYDLFCGLLQNTIQCKRCQSTKVSFEPFWDLSLGFKNKKKGSQYYFLKDMLEDFTKEEIVSQECEICQENCQATCKTTIYKLPEILIITFKRFRYQDGWTKIQDNIKFPTKKLDLVDFVKGSSILFGIYYDSDLLLEGTETENSSYDLFGIINHQGSLKSGHYYADCKNHCDENWWRYNDNDVKEIYTKSDNKEICCAPSILFYARPFKQIKNNLYNHSDDYVRQSGTKPNIKEFIFAPPARPIEQPNDTQNEAQDQELNACYRALCKYDI